MNPIPYFICVALGIAIDAAYRKRSEIAERKAYEKGYNKGYKAAEREVIAKYKKHQELPLFDESYTIETETDAPKRNIKTVPESFMDNLHRNGSAVIKLK